MLYGINKDFWGRGAWDYMKAAVLSYPEHPTPADILRYSTFFTSLMSVLPCEDCKAHFKKQMDEHPLEPVLPNGRRALLEWILARENTVRATQDRPARELAVVVGQYLPESEYDSVGLTPAEKTVARANRGISPSPSLPPPPSSPSSSCSSWKVSAVVLAIALALAIGVLIFFLLKSK